MWMNICMVLLISKFGLEQNHRAHYKACRCFFSPLLLTELKSWLWSLLQLSVRCFLNLLTTPNPTNVKLGFSPIQNCQRKRSYDRSCGCGALGGGVRADVCAKGTHGGQRRIASLQWGAAAEYFMVMDVPHGVPVSGVFGARQGVLTEARGRLGALLHRPASLWKNAGRGCCCGFWKDSSTWGKRGVTEGWRGVAWSSVTTRDLLFLLT